MPLTKWLIPPRMSIAVFEEGNPGMFVSIPCTTASSRQKLKFKFAMKSLIYLIYQSKPFCTRNYKVLLSVTESIGNVRSHQRPDFKTRFQSQQSSCLFARCPSWKMNMSCWPSYYGLKNDTQNMFFNCSWNYHFLPPVSDASANLLAYIFVVTCHSFAHELMFSRFE